MFNALPGATGDSFVTTGESSSRVNPIEIRLPLRSAPGRTSVAFSSPALVWQKSPSSVAAAESNRGAPEPEVLDAIILVEFGDDQPFDGGA
jgi:hypothetical protein